MKIRESSNRGLVLAIIATAGMVTLFLMQWNIGYKSQKISEKYATATEVSEFIHQLRLEQEQYLRQMASLEGLEQSLFESYLDIDKILYDDTRLIEAFKLRQPNSPLEQSNLPDLESLRAAIREVSLDSDVIEHLESGSPDSAFLILNSTQYIEHWNKEVAFLESFNQQHRQERDEAYAALDAKQTKLFGNLGIMLFVVIGAMYFEFSSRNKNLIRPVEKLNEAALRVAAGDYSYRIENPDDKDNEIGTLAKAFNEMAASIDLDIQKREETERVTQRLRIEAEAANSSKSEFLANMSHEIRTPLNAIIGLTELALNTGLTNRQRDYITKVNTAGNALLGVLNDILDLSKIESGKLEIEQIEFNLESLFDTLSAVIATSVEEKNLELVFDIAPDVPRCLRGDPLRLGQILQNLTSNARKFTEQGDIVVRVSCLATNQTNGLETAYLQFDVEDSGIGITDDQLDRIFHAFMQADESTTRRFGGTGLGLTISRQLVEMMGGEIWVNSKLGDGSTFSFKLPLTIAEASSCTDLCTDVQKHSISALNVLIVDDNHHALAAIDKIVKSLGCKTMSIDNPGALTDTLLAAQDQGSPIDVCLIDQGMSPQTGLETLELVKNNPRIQSQPSFFLLIGASRSIERELDSNSGAEFALLTKPLSRKSILDGLLISTGSLPSDNLANAHLSVQELTRPIRGSKVLLVEDNLINQQVAQEFLNQAGLVVEITDNGQKAVERVQTEAFDAVLMDIQMPVMDGYTATSKIRSIKGLESLPILAMTANVMAQDRTKVKEAGMNDHIGKPIEARDLYQKLLKWIPHKSYQTDTPMQGNTDSAVDELEVVLPQALPGMDIDAALVNVSGNKKLLVTLINQFVTDHKDDSRLILQFLSDGRLAEAELIAHTLKGISGTLVAKELNEAVTTIETKLKQREQLTPSDLDPLIRSLDDFCAQLSESLLNIRANQNLHKEGTRELSLIIPELEQSLDEMDPNCINLAEELVQSATEHHDLVNQIRADAELFDFESASKSLDKFKKLIG